jgi:hypothetical protein
MLSAASLDPRDFASWFDVTVKNLVPFCTGVKLGFQT